jgi:hypothetical protein
MVKRIPIAQLTELELRRRCEAILRACHQREGHLDVPDDLVDALRECHAEAHRRGIADAIELADILKRDDPAPVVHRRAIVRYLKEPHLSSFLSGVVSFAPANVYKDDPHFARRDNEHERPYMVHDQPLEFDSGQSYFGTQIRMRHRIAASYHIVSFSAEQSMKLKRAFAADGAVLLREPKLFVDLVWEELSRSQPGATLELARVKYYDPMAGGATPKKGTEILHRKPLDFAWHREARLVMLGGEPEDHRINASISPPTGLFQLVEF